MTPQSAVQDDLDPRISSRRPHASRSKSVLGHFCAPYNASRSCRLIAIDRHPTVCHGLQTQHHPASGNARHVPPLNRRRTYYATAPKENGSTIDKAKTPSLAALTTETIDRPNQNTKNVKYTSQHTIDTINKANSYLYGGRRHHSTKVLIYQIWSNAKASAPLRRWNHLDT